MSGERNVVRFVPGDATAVVGDRLTALVHADADAPVVQALQGLVSERTEQTSAVVDVLMSHGIDHLPGFAIVIREQGGGRVFARGSVIVDIDDGRSAPGTFDRVDGGKLFTWIERPMTHCREARLAVIGSGITFDGTLYSASFGVLPAVGVELLWFESDLAPGPGPAEGSTETPMVSEQEPIPEPTDDNRPATDPGADEVPEPDAVPHGSATDDPSPGNLAVSAGAAVDETQAGQPDEEALLPTSSTVTVLGVDTYLEPPMEAVPSSQLSGHTASDMIPPADGLSMTGNYDELFGSTQFRSVEGAAVRPAGQDETGAVFEGGAAASRTDHAGDAYDPLHDGRTLTSAQLRKLRGERAASLPTSLQGTSTDVLAVLCQRGHPNAPHDMRCRQCGTPIEEQSPTVMPRPPLGRFTFSSGQEVTIDRTMLIGRSPKANGPLKDGQVPELIQLESPDKDISRTHLEVRVEGWQVFAVDQNSANGTVVFLPGRSEQRLRPDEPFLLTVGARVRLADEVEFTMEALA